MILVVIDNYKFLLKIINYLENANIKYTTDLEDEYDYILIAEFNKKNIEFIDNNIKGKKRIIFLTYLEENKIYNHYKSNSISSKKYNDWLYKNLKKCSLIIVSLPFFKNLILKKIKTKIEVIEFDVDYLINKNYKKQKNSILIIDFYYEHLNHIFELVNEYPKYNFTLLGFKPHYMLSKKNKLLFENIPPNIFFIKYYTMNDYINIVKNTQYVIYYNNDFKKYIYLANILSLKKQLIVKNSEIYDNYLINSKNIYLFDNEEELNKKLKKMLENRITNLSGDCYILVKDNNFNKTCQKLKKIL